ILSDTLALHDALPISPPSAAPVGMTTLACLGGSGRDDNPRVPRRPCRDDNLRVLRRPYRDDNPAGHRNPLDLREPVGVFLDLAVDRKSTRLNSSHVSI